MNEEKKTTNVEPESTTTPTAASKVRVKLAEYGVSEDAIEKIVTELGVEEIADLASLEVNDLTYAGMKLAKAKRLTNDLRSATKPVATPAVAAAETRAIQSQFETLLPAIPNDESWLDALKTGGVLKVEESSYIAAIRAALADKAGLYDVPNTLSTAMEKYADEAEEQVDPTFFALRKSLTRRAYGDIFAAIDGLDGTFITDKRRKEFLARIRNTLWPTIVDSYRTLDGWYKAWKAGFSDPSMLVVALSGGLSAGAAGMNMITPPDTAQLHDAGDALVDAVNRIFRGPGVQVAAAMAYDASTIRKTLENPRLPAMIGVKNREMMLKKIGANVSSNYVRLEQNLVRYVLGFTRHDAVTSDVEINYFVALYQLGAQINWSELGVASSGTGNGVTSLTGESFL